MVRNASVSGALIAVIRDPKSSDIGKENLARFSGIRAVYGRPEILAAPNPDRSVAFRALRIDTPSNNHPRNGTPHPAPIGCTAKRFARVHDVTSGIDAQGRNWSRPDPALRRR